VHGSLILWCLTVYLSDCLYVCLYLHVFLSVTACLAAFLPLPFCFSVCVCVCLSRRLLKVQLGRDLRGLTKVQMLRDRESAESSTGVKLRTRTTYSALMLMSVIVLTSTDLDFDTVERWMAMTFPLFDRIFQVAML